MNFEIDDLQTRHSAAGIGAEQNRADTACFGTQSRAERSGAKSRLESLEFKSAAGTRVKSCPMLSLQGTKQEIVDGAIWCLNVTSHGQCHPKSSVEAPHRTSALRAIIDAKARR